MREDVSSVKSLWDHEVERIRLTEAYLVKRWGAVDALQMEDLTVERWTGGTGNEASVPWGSTGNFHGDLMGLTQYEWDLMNRRLMGFYMRFAQQLQPQYKLGFSGGWPSNNGDWLDFTHSKLG